MRARRQLRPRRRSANILLSKCLLALLLKFLYQLAKDSASMVRITWFSNLLSLLANIRFLNRGLAVHFPGSLASRLDIFRGLAGPRLSSRAPSRQLLPAVFRRDLIRRFLAPFHPATPSAALIVWNRLATDSSDFFQNHLMALLRGAL